MTQKLTESDIDQRLGELPEWTKVNEEIQRTYHFDDFVNSMAFVNKVADAAERDQHHPDILIRYNKVTLTLSTHDAGGITEKDFALASYCDSIA
ncbi:MAG: 4a-hydroxytetrahydrobiopterin dehydratase [Phycisphaerales bacterium]|nr:4a-hydroxytetrahydrobiopterin dehydratase [Phycisphaerales bacterium]